jgi:hypothetical protein
MRGTMEKTKEEKEREAPQDRREQMLIRTRTCSLSNETLEVSVSHCVSVLFFFYICVVYHSHINHMVIIYI